MSEKTHKPELVTPRTNAITERMAGELNRLMLQANHMIEMCDWSRQLERELTVERSNYAILQAKFLEDEATIANLRDKQYIRQANCLLNDDAPCQKLQDALAELAELRAGVAAQR